MSMGLPMKTTIEVSDVLFASAKKFAQQRQTTMRALVEDGLRRVLNDAQAKIQPAFKLKDESVRGKRMLISDARRWQQMEEDHVTSRAMKPRHDRG